MRGNHIESEHLSKSLIMNLDKNKLFSTNNENDYIFPRSSIKIMQAIPFASSSSIKTFNLNEKQIALSCSSHSGENYHIKQLNNWLKKIKIKKTQILCGIHNPLDNKSSDKLLLSGIKSDQLCNNCAGKHMAMLSSSLVNNYKTNNYLDFNHPHQLEIKKTLEAFSESKIYKKNYAIDGCSAPQYAFRFINICNILINLVNSYNSNFEKTDEVKVLLSAILKNPFFIGGYNNLDSNLINFSNKKLFCKGGAEGVLLFAHLKKNIVGLIKVSDGNERILPSVVYKLFKKFKILNSYELSAYKKWHNNIIYNHAGKTVGKIFTEIK